MLVVTTASKRSIGIVTSTIKEE
uniref:Uncharacterized protein n=1 Tax=Moniliophthora roreri TaxID=221103 RepID=A0A0W0FQZ5_MONRR